MFYKEKFYSLINWKNRPNLSTPLGAKNLNKMDKAIGELDERVVETSKEAEKNKLNVQNLGLEVESISKDIEEVRESTQYIDSFKIVTNKSGAPVYIDDASNMNIENIVFYGESKQMPQDILFSPSVVFAPLTESGITVTPVANNGFKISGTNTSTNSSVYYDLYYSKTDMLCSETFVFDTGVPDGTIDYMYYEYPAGGGSFMRLNTSVKTSTITVGKGVSGQQIRLYIPKGKTINTTIYPTVKPVNPSPDYPQPIEPSSVGSVSVYRKNLLNPSRFATKTSNGVTFTPVFEDGLLQYININTDGPATADSYYAIVDKTNVPKEALVLNGCEGGSASTYSLLITYRNEDDTYADQAFQSQTDADLPIDASKKKYSVTIFVKSGATVNNARIYPMLRPTFFTDGTYEPYQSQTAYLSRLFVLNRIGGVRDTIEIYSDGTGKYIQRIGKVVANKNTRFNTLELSTLQRVSFTITNMLNLSGRNADVLSSHFVASIEGTIYSMFHVGTEIYLYVGVNNATDFNSFIADKEITFYYPIAEPIETALPQADIDAIKNLHTYKPNTVVMNDGDAEMEVEYVADVKSYIDSKFRELATVIVNQ